MSNIYGMAIRFDFGDFNTSLHKDVQKIKKGRKEITFGFKFKYVQI